MGAEFIITIVAATLASSGLWSLILYKVQKRDIEKDSITKLILGLAYREITELCLKYINRGYITKDEYEDLIRYLFTPYEELGGNGTAKKLVDEVKKLPIKEGEPLWTNTKN